MKWYKDRKNYIIIIGNLIPLFGFIVLKWNITETFLFYVFELIIYEIIMIPKIFLFAFTRNKLKGADKAPGPKSIVGKLFASIGFLIFNGLMFGVVLMGFSMFALSPDFSFTADIDYLISISTTFLQTSYLILIFIGLEYIYNFINDHIIRKEYLSLQFNFQYNEVWGRTMFVFMFAVNIPIIMYVLLQPPESNYIAPEDTKVYNLVLLLGIIICKTIGELLIKRIKTKLISEYNSEKNI